jgi:hypothetical protein
VDLLTSCHRSSLSNYPDCQKANLLPLHLRICCVCTRRATYSIDVADGAVALARLLCVHPRATYSIDVADGAVALARLLCVHPRATYSIDVADGAVTCFVLAVDKHQQLYSDTGGLAPSADPSTSTNTNNSIHGYIGYQ